MQENDTIAAIATAVGNAGISIIRISGMEAVSVTDAVFRPKKKSKKLSAAKTHTIHYGYIYDGDKMIDEVLVALMRAPSTYTREDVVEINCHGGMMVTRKVLETVLKHGARVAEPGEFTKRAFLNGRIDLSQAEAVMDLIHAGSNLALQSSIQHLQGGLKEEIESIRKMLVHDLAWIEASLDDPEHIEMDGYIDELKSHIIKAKKQCAEILSTADMGRVIKEGVRVVLAGSPNVGKSSLLNLLAGQERAIVTDVAGTTRDVLEEEIHLDDMVLFFIDTAGIHKTSDQVENIGINKAKRSIEDADLVIHIFDVSKELQTEEKEIAEMTAGKPVIALLNKMDLGMAFEKEQVKQIYSQLQNELYILPFSATKGIGLDELKHQIGEMFYKGIINFNDQVYLTNVRHKQAVNEAVESLQAVEESIRAGMPEDFFTIDLMDACAALGKITGAEVHEELIHTIFSDFCMGK